MSVTPVAGMAIAEEPLLLSKGADCPHQPYHSRNPQLRRANHHLSTSMRAVDGSYPPHPTTLRLLHGLRMDHSSCHFALQVYKRGRRDTAPHTLEATRHRGISEARQRRAFIERKIRDSKGRRPLHFSSCSGATAST